MARLWKKSLLLATSMVLPTFALTACAGDSQYGTVTSVYLNYDNSGNQNTDDFNFNNKYSNSEYGFNNWNDSNLTYQWNGSGSNWASYSSSGYVKFLSDMVISLGQFVEKLVTASLVGFTKDSPDKNIIFNESPQTDENFLQFLYAASNSLNFGQNGQLGFGLTCIKTDIDGPINPQDGGNFQVVSKDSKQLGYTNYNANVTFTFIFGYWNSGNDNPTSNGGVSVSDVQNYANNVWSQKFNNYYTYFDIELNLKARIQSVFTMSDDFVNNAGVPSSDNWSDDGGFLYDTEGAKYSPTNNDDLKKYFIINGSDSNFNSFNFQLGYSLDSVDSSWTFLNNIGTYDSSSSFKDNYTNTDSAFRTAYNSLSETLSNEDLKPKDLAKFAGFLSFYKAYSQFDEAYSQS